MKTIHLTQGLAAVVDDDDYERVSAYKWQAHKNNRNPGSFYAQAGIRGADGKFHTVMMHRFVMNAEKGVHVDHINRDGLCNTKSNLRLCNQSQNFANRTKQSNNTTGFKGVVFLKGRYFSRIKYLGKQIRLGSFVNPEAAALAYDTKARELFGEFACLNFPEVKMESAA